jgi:hypothetical protein
LSVCIGRELVVANALTQLIAQFFHQGVGCIVTIRIPANIGFKRELETAEVYLMVAEPFTDIERLGARSVADEQPGRLPSP